MCSPTILTIILNYRTPHLAIQSAKAARREMADLNGEIVIVDNHSNDGSDAAIADAIAENGWDQDGRMHLLKSGRNGGFGAGINLAMQSGLSNGERPDFYYILNSDAWPEPGAIQALLGTMQANPRVGLAGSYIRGPDGAPHSTAFRFPSIAGEFEAAVRTGIVSRWLRHAVVPLPLPAHTAPVDWVAGASVLMRAAMLEEVGLFDERFFLYYEETDLCYRAARAGWQTFYVPQSEVVHIGSVSTGMKTWPRTPQYWFDSRGHYFTKTHGRAYAGGATVAAISGAALWRFRARVAGRPTGDTPHYLRDLIRHAWCGMFRRTARPVPVFLPPMTCAQNIDKDLK